MLMGSENSGNELLRKLADVAKRLGEGGNPDDHDTRTLLADAKFQLSSGPSACELLETIGIDLPSIFMKIAVTTTGACKELAESLLEILLKSCDARDMFTAYMEVLDLYTVPDSPEICFLLLDGLSKIFVRIQRRRTAYIKDSVLGILKAVRAVADTDYSWKVVDKAIQLAIVLVDLTLHEKVNEQIQKLHEILAIFILLLLEQVSEIKQVNYSITVQPMIMQLARQLSVCGLTDLDLITGRFCEKVIDALTDDLVDGDGYIVQVKQGAMVAVWWRFCFDKEAMDYQETVDSIMIGLRSSRHVFRSVLSNPLVLLSSVEKTWKRVEMGVDLLSTFLEWGIEHSDGPFQIHSDILEPDDFIELYKVLEVLQNVILFCPQSATRQNAYKVLVNMIRNVLPPEEKFKALKQLITQSEQSSMISLLMYVVKEEVDNAISLRRDPSKQHLNSPFASEKVMELINFVLRPTTGPPELPQQIDAVLSALNLYRFLLIKEEAGRSNYTGVLLKSSLEEACSKWFHPLRTFLEGFKRSFCASDADVTASVLLSVSCVEGVLYRCLELAEAALKNHYT